MTDAVEPMNPTVAPATAAPLTGTGLWRIGAVVLASLLLVAMVVFLVAARADRDDAEVARREAAAHLRDARNRAADDEELRAMAVTRTSDGMKTFDALTVPLDELVNLAERELVLATGARDAGATNSQARVEEYNDLTSRSNEVVDQYNAKLQGLEAQIRATVPGATKAV